MYEHRDAVMKWSTGRHTVTYSDKSSTVLHTAHVGYVEHVLANRAAVGHALHRTHYQWFSFYFLLLSATLLLIFVLS